VRVERALGLLPDVEAVAPLRALLFAISRPDASAVWSSSGPYLTLSKRGVRPEDLDRRMPQAFRQITDHLRAVYEAYVTALECEQRGDGNGVAAALLSAGRLEHDVGRLAEARAWYDVARGISETLQDRSSEVECLLALGRVALGLGAPLEAARQFQRALALAEAEFDQARVTAACEGLGETSLVQGQLTGAQAWLGRALRMAEAANDTTALGRVERQLGVLAGKQGDLGAAAEHLSLARQHLEAAGTPQEMARTLSAQGDLDATLGRTTAAATAYREALAWAQRAPRDLGLELTIRLGLAEVHMDGGHFIDADEEMRRAEEAAIGGNLPRRLVQVYTLMGKLRGRQRDETGFVFFEQAIALCRTLQGAIAVEAKVYFEYGRYAEALGRHDEAKAYLERAREIFASAGEAVEQQRAEAELRAMSA
jgi:tetratricopeptide (TPR) repeat protein